jgi:prepilin-type N-terminal cleavage/methylation domain-containing protein
MQMKRSRSRGFTLVELLVVITVIALLAALTISAAMKVRITMRVRVARGSASRMGQAVEAYQALMNFLPVHTLYDPEADADDYYQNYEIINQLNGVMSRDPLLKLEEEEMNEKGSFKDPWGKPFRVVMWKERPTDQVYKYFQVYSCGQNAKWEFGNGDDVVGQL